MRSKTLIYCFLHPFDCSSAAKLGSISPRAHTLSLYARQRTPYFHLPLKLSVSVSLLFQMPYIPIKTYFLARPPPAQSASVSAAYTPPGQQAGDQDSAAAKSSAALALPSGGDWLLLRNKKGVSMVKVQRPVVSSLYFAPERGLPVL